MINTKKLRQAIKTADTARIKEILRDAPKEEIRLAYDWTPLHVAAKRGNRDVVAAILEAITDINATSEMHQTPLDIALKHDLKNVAELLRKKGARSGAELSLHPAVAAEYLAYAPAGGAFTMDLSTMPSSRKLAVEWFNPAVGLTMTESAIPAGSSSQPFNPPFSGDAVLYLVDTVGHK